MKRWVRSASIPESASGARQPSVFSQSVAGTAARSAIILLSLANGVILARTLGPAGLGQLFVFIQLLALLAVLAEGGLSHSAASFVGRSVAATRYVHGLVLRLVPLTALVTVIFAAPVLGLIRGVVLPHFSTELIWIAFASLPFAVYANVWMGMMAGLGRIVEASGVLLVGTVVWVALTLLVVAVLQLGVIGAATVYAAYQLVQAGIMAGVGIYLLGPPTRVSPGPGTARSFGSFAGRAYPGAVAYLLWIRMPVFLLNAFSGPGAVGIFSAAQQLVERTLIPVSALQAAMLRDMSTLSRQTSTHAINRCVRFASAGMACVVVAAIPLAGPIVHLLLGDAYGGAVPVLRILLLGLAFSACALLLDSYFLNQLGRPGLLSALAGVQVVLVTGLGALLVPRFGVLGAAASLVATQVLGTLVYVRWHLRFSHSRARDLVLLTRGDVRAFRHQLAIAVSRLSLR